MDGATTCPFERLHDEQLSLIVKNCTSTSDLKSLSLTCQRLCRLVRTSRRLRLWLGLQDTQQLQQVPASRAFQQVDALYINLQDSDLQQGLGCWWDMAERLSSSVQRWADIQEVGIYGDTDLFMESTGMRCMAAPLAALKGAAALRQLSLVNVMDPGALQHLEQLTQVTALHLSDRRIKPEPISILGVECSAPLAALTSLRRLEMPFGRCLTDEADEEYGINDWNCPLALPPNLTSLHMWRMDCYAGALWRHIAACSALEELRLPVAGPSPITHPTWALKELAGSLGRLKRLTISWEPLRKGCPTRRLGRLLGLLYMPEHLFDMGDHQAAAAALRLAVAAGMPATGMDLSVSDQHAMPLPPNMARCSSLEVLELPGVLHSSWWLICAMPQHWVDLAGCTALRQLQGLHASQPPPAGVSFPCVTRLEVVVAPGDAVQVLAAFPALRELKITSVLQDEPFQEHPEMQGTGPHATPKPVQCPSATSLILDLDPLRHRTSSNGSSSGSSSRSSRSSNRTPDVGAAAAYCSTLWRALPGLTDLELVCPAGVVLPSLVPLTGLTSLVLQLLPEQPAAYGAGIACTEIARSLQLRAVLQMLQGAPGLQKLVLCMQVAEVSREWLVQQVHRVLSGLQEHTLQIELP